MKRISLIIAFLFSNELFANDAVDVLRKHKNLEGLIISFCTLDNKVCSKIDRSKPDLSLSQAIKMSSFAAQTMDDLKPNFESIQMKYKISDLADQKSSVEFSYVRPKKLK